MVSKKKNVQIKESAKVKKLNALLPIKYIESNKTEISSDQCKVCLRCEVSSCQRGLQLTFGPMFATASLTELSVCVSLIQFDSPA